MPDGRRSGHRVRRIAPADRPERFERGQDDDDHAAAGFDPVFHNIGACPDKTRPAFGRLTLPAREPTL